ncbi:monooxygenase [Mycobacteroides abscessus subsp. abscessus]|nr:monooxygenase [Mycobacteroides abscessus subsp. abscessus]
MNPEHETVIIGAGIGGLGAAIGLKRAGLTDFIILERSAGIGGTWYNNHYPDVAVDVPGIVYQFSFAKNPDWSRTFPKGREVQQYIAGLVERYRLNNHLRLGHHDYDLSGKRIAVIGTGATSVQLIPQMARVASHLDVYQRRAIWVFAKPDFPIPRVARWALKYIPGLQSLIRGIAAAAVEVGLVAITVYGKQIAPITLIPNWACRAFLFTQVRDRELRKKLTPEYGFGCKRPSVSNIYYRTFTQPHVDLVTDPIAEITPTGIVTRDGVRRDIDVLVLATGFEMSQSPEVYRARPVKGRNGFDLADYYENNRARAYEGVTMPQLPNTFMVFGPFAWSGSSWHVMVENATRIAVRVITEARKRGATAFAVTEEANNRFFEFIAPKAESTLMHGRACVNANSYYIDRHGDFSFLRPTTAYQSTRASKRFPLDDFRFERLPESTKSSRLTGTATTRSN